MSLQFTHLVKWCDRNINEREINSHLKFKGNSGTRMPNCLAVGETSTPASSPSQLHCPGPLGPALASGPFVSHLCFRMASSLVCLYRPGRGQEEGSAQTLQHLASGLNPCSVLAGPREGLITWESTSPSHLGPGAPQLGAGGGCTRRCPAAATRAQHPRWQ